MHIKLYEREWSCTSDLLYNENNLIGRLYRYFYIYFGRPTCIDCRNFEQYLLDVLSENNIEIFYFNTDYWRNREGTQDIYSRFGIENVPQIIRIDSEGNISRYNYDQENGDLKDSIKHFLGLDGLKMIRYLVSAD